MQPNNLKRESVRVVAPERHAASEERAAAALGYLFWPLALPALLNTGDLPRSPWLRHHARQAVIIGTVTLVVVLVVFSLPLIVLGSQLIPYASTVGLYEISFVLDIICIGIAFSIGIYAAQRASKGEHFAIASLLPIAKKDLP